MDSNSKLLNSVFFAELIFKNRMSELEIELDFKKVGSVLNLTKITCTRPKLSKNKELELTSVLPISVKSNFNSTKRACEFVCSGWSTDVCRVGKICYCKMFTKHIPKTSPCNLSRGKRPLICKLTLFSYPKYTIGSRRESNPTLRMFDPRATLLDNIIGK